jgi:hypothetical protein
MNVGSAFRGGGQNGTTPSKGKITSQYIFYPPPPPPIQVRRRRSFKTF